MNDENPAPPVDTIERSTDEAQPAPAPAPRRNPLVASGGRPMAIIPHTFEEAYRIGVAAVVGQWAPKGWTDKQATMAIMHGAEIGLPPMMSLQKIAVINGRPSVWGDAVVAIAMATGQLEDWDEGITGEGEDMVAYCKVKRRGMATPRVETFSVKDAIQAGLWSPEPIIRKQVWEGPKGNRQPVWKDGQPNDSPWHRHPKRMMQMRARRAFRDMFADAFSGLYIAEEIMDEPALRDVTPAGEQHHESHEAEDVVDNPLGGEDAAAEPVRTQVQVVSATKTVTGTVVTNPQDLPAGTTVTPTEPAGEPKPKRQRKTKAKPEDAQAIDDEDPPLEAAMEAHDPETGEVIEGEVIPPAPTKHPDTVPMPATAAFTRWSGTDYVAYLTHWCNVAAVHEGEPSSVPFLRETYIRDRHKREMAIRNQLGTMLTNEQRDAIKDICLDAIKGNVTEASEE